MSEEREGAEGRRGRVRTHRHTDGDTDTQTQALKQTHRHRHTDTDTDTDARQPPHRPRTTSAQAGVEGVDEEESGREKRGVGGSGERLRTW
eukprot:1454770-Rhodomonas_salina.1